MAKIWRKTEMRGCKYLVVRRDGTLPQWPYFVLGAADPYAPRALQVYAAVIRTQKGDAEYADSVMELAEDFENWRVANTTGDPTAGPHRKDEPSVVDAMEQTGGSVVLAPISPQNPRPDMVLIATAEFAKLRAVYDAVMRLPEGKHLITVEEEKAQAVLRPEGGATFEDLDGKRITIVPKGLNGFVRLSSA